MIQQFIGQIFRFFPLFRGKYRLASLFIRDRENITNVFIQGKNNVQYYIPNIKEIIGFSLFINGEYETDNIDFIVERIPQNGIFIDVGANIGAITVSIAKQRPDVHIIAIEASPRVFEYLSKNVEINNCENVTILNKAIAEEDDKNVSFFSPEELFGKGSLSPVFTDKAEMVQTITLDSVYKRSTFSNIDFIKVDVEGFEKMIFLSGAELLSSGNAPKILFEFSAWMESQLDGSNAGDAQRILIDYGYNLFDASNPSKLIPMQEPKIDGTYMIYAEK
jgi:FkbM family methyltransferase